MKTKTEIKTRIQELKKLGSSAITNAMAYSLEAAALSAKLQKLEQLEEIRLQAIYDVSFPMGIMRDVGRQIEQLERELQLA